MFRSREELRKVPRMGPKAFEQSAGFLRIRDGVNPLDNSAVHPESYHIVEKMALESSHTGNGSDRRMKICEKKWISKIYG